jgi:hypothetical protein
LARAAAQELNRYFLAETITAASEGQDLLWKYDPVARLSDAQTLAAESALRNRRRMLRQGTEERQTISTEPVAALQAEQANTHRKKKVARHRKKKSSRQKDKNIYQLSRNTIPKTIGRIEIPERQERSHVLRPGNFISPGVLWWAFDCLSAYKQYTRCCYPFYKPGFLYEEADELETAERGFVLLIDEIDKADSSLPNTLLEVLGNGGFHVPMLNESVGMAPGLKKPLVIITTNEEEELPAAFVRRCLVLQLHFEDREYLRSWWRQQMEGLSLPSDDFSQEKTFILWLIHRAEVHFEGVFSDKIKIQAAKLLIKDRQAAQRIGGPKPGQAEFLDLLRALRDMPTPNYSGEALEQYRLALLKKISRYALTKSAAE